MASKSKKGSRKKSVRPNTRKKLEGTEKKALLSRSAKQDIVAIILIGLAVLLIVAFFGGAGSAGNAFMNTVKALIGQATYLVPATFFGLAILLFLPKRFELRSQNYLGLISFFIVLAGILQFALAGDGTTLDALPNQGGFIGYGLWLILHPLLTTPLAIFLLVLVELVVIVIATGVRLADLVRKLFGRSQLKEAKLEVKQPSFAVNNKLPFRGEVGADDEVKTRPGPKPAMTATLDKDWKYPPLDLLKVMSTKADAGNEKDKANIIQKTFQDFGIEVSMVGVNVGPTVAQYTLKPSSGVKLSKITGLDKNLALALKAPHLRIEAPIAGTDLVGIEVPNEKSAQVRLRDILESKEMQTAPSRLEFALGRDVAGEIISADLASMPHLLVAGATKAGKSVMINTMLTSLLYRNSPAQLRFILVDPKRVELTPYNDIPHLLTPVITDHEKAISAMKWAVAEMERRLNLLSDHGKRDIGEYNEQKGVDGMPYIVIVLDEFADLMVVAGKDVESLIVRIAQMARAVGIHLVLATQRPSVGVVTGLIKANLPARLALTTASQIDSRTIIDQSGAEKLLGKGDMLFLSPEFMKPKRVQGVLLTSDEVSSVTKFLRDERGPEYNEEVLAQVVKIGPRGVMQGDGGSGDDPLYDEVAEFVMQTGKASASVLQRRFRVGYSRAARLMDMLESNGVIGPQDGSKARVVLMSSADTMSTDGIGYEQNIGENVSADE